MILGVLEPTSGTILIEGADIAADRSRALERTNFAAVYAPLPGNLTVLQNLRVFGLLYGVKELPERIEALLDRFDLKGLRHAKCGVLSSGEQTRVNLAKAMLNRPRLLLLDEPTASLDPAVARDIRAQVSRVRRPRRQWACFGPRTTCTKSRTSATGSSSCRTGRILLEGDPRSLPREHGKETLEELFIAVAREPLALKRT